MHSMYAREPTEEEESNGKDLFSEREKDELDAIYPMLRMFLLVVHLERRSMVEKRYRVVFDIVSHG